MKITLDMRTDLAKVTEETLGRLGDCRYSAPCAIGAMMTPEQREYLENNLDSDNHFMDDDQIHTLIDEDVVEVPADQAVDFITLQRAFDRADTLPTSFWATLARLKDKYCG